MTERRMQPARASGLSAFLEDSSNKISASKDAANRENAMPQLTEHPAPKKIQIELLKAAVKHVEGPDRLRLVQLLQQAETPMCGERILLPAEPKLLKKAGAD